MALTADRLTDQFGTPDVTLPVLHAFPQGVNTIYAGSLVATNSSGYAVRASADVTLKIWGVAEKQSVNAGSAGDINVLVRKGCFYFAQTGTTITKADVGKLCYASDDQTVSLSDSSGTRPAAGVVMQVRADAQVAVYVGQPALYQTDAVSAGATLTTQYKARGVVYSNVADLTAFTVATNTDGITYVAGDIVLLANQTTAAQNGPYVVGTVATTAPLTRPIWWATGAAIPLGQIIDIYGGGTLFGNSQWKVTKTSAGVVGTDDPAFYPKLVKATVQLSSGSYALGSAEGLYLLSLTTSIVQATRQTANGTLTLTTHYYCPSASSGRVTGTSGTAVVTVKASVAAGTVNTADTSFIDVLVTNW